MSLCYSKHNMLSPIHNQEQWILVNLLSGQADILEANVGARANEGVLPQGEELQEWIDKGYVVEPSAEEALYRRRYLDFLDMRDKDEVQLFFVPWYSCNFACTYCFQDEYEWNTALLKPEVVDAFFDYLKNGPLAGRRKYLTLFGGEPLLPSAAHRSLIEDFLQRATDANLDVAIVTNGYSLLEYLPSLAKAKIREIQVTLDGPAEMHNSRRTRKGGGDSFERIIQGVDAALALGISINLRMVVDKENLPTLPELSSIAQQRGWTANPLFKTQLGRNYELHSCQEDSSKIFGRAEMYVHLLELIKQHPHILEFHKPAYSIVKFLWEHGETPIPLFDACTGTKTEWAFDYQGRIFACTATVGKAGEELGTFWPQVQLDRTTIDLWEERDVTTIPGCRECTHQLACGGGCAAVARNKNGTVASQDCRPIHQLLGLGAHLYFNEPEVQSCPQT